MTVRIEFSYATFAIEVEGGRVVKAAPIGRWMVGKSIGEVVEWVGRKGGRVKRVDE